MLDVSEAANDVDDTLDVKIQHSPDNGFTWDDIVHFTQVLGNGGAVKEMAFIGLEAIGLAASPGNELRAPSTDLLAGCVVQGPVFPYIRAVGTIVDADGDGGFTYSVTMQAIR